MCQILITLLFVVVATFHIPTKHYINAHWNLPIIACIVVIFVLIILACCGEYRRKSPLNYILLLIFTIAESFLVAVSVSHHYPEHVILALGLTSSLCFFLILFALQTKIDFTVMGVFLMILTIILLVVTIVAIFFPSKLIIIIISSAGAIIFSLYLVYDIQLMMGGDHKYSISPEEYIFAALNIYVDLINIFIFILNLIGIFGRD